MSNILIGIENLTKKFGQNQVLKGINLSINGGQTTTIIGKSGIGKSVLLKHIMGLIKPDTGCITYKGQDINKMSKKKRAEINGKFSYMFQETALLDSMTVYDNIALPVKEKNKFTSSELKVSVRNQIEQLDLSGTENKYPSQLSGGMKKRVAMARALITEPEVILFDEPTSGLDPIRKNTALGMIERYQKRLKFSSIIISHDIPDIFDISHRIAMISNGKIIFEGNRSEIFSSHNSTVKKFITGKYLPVINYFV